jgi:hypothetical protein
MTAPQISSLLRLALFILSALMALYGARDRRPVLALYWAGVAAYWLLYFVVS